MLVELQARAELVKQLAKPTAAPLLKLLARQQLPPPLSIFVKLEPLPLADPALASVRVQPLSKQLRLAPPPQFSRGRSRDHPSRRVLALNRRG